LLTASDGSRLRHHIPLFEAPTLSEKHAQTASSHSTGKSIGFREFLVLIAVMMACQALAVDAMLPALPTIAHAFGLSDENRAQWIVTAYVAGLGLGQLFWGIISDRFGRRSVLLTGLALYAVAALLVGLASSFTTLLSWRFVHGVAAASVVVARSVVRDLYEGREMARVMSLTFIVFIMIPIIAPSIGQAILVLAPWRYLFVVFSVFGCIVWLWALLRLPETLHPKYRLTLTVDHVLQATKRVLGNRISLFYTLALTTMFGSILAYVGMVQQIFAEVFHRPGMMPGMFALCAAALGVVSFVNSRIVERIGMRIVSQIGLLIFIAVTAIHTLVAAFGLEGLPTFVVLQAATMGCIGLIMANFGAMAMEPMGAVAGVAASLQGCISTAGAAMVGALIGRQFNGSTLPLALGAAACGLLALLFVLVAEQWRLFRPHHGARAEG
jgi:DHA1 family bicyclomycin/chloramphenicol resistance-like MFS transporter